MKDYIQIIGFIATLLTILSFTFKEILTIRMVNVLGSFVWLLYGFYTKDHPVIMVNVSVILIQIWGIFNLVKDRFIKS
ncbi:MAG: YgjV family protein [Chitinophagaceae bacterium]|nr:YgjV family protein [Chitinophagaceae bacterium]